VKRSGDALRASVPGFASASLIGPTRAPNSVLESCARVIFAEHGLDPPELQFTITGRDFRYCVHFYWLKYRVVAEADGQVKYSDPRRAVRRLDRDQRLRDLGYKVVHFTWRELFQNPAAVIERNRRAFLSATPV
jgi:Protein of unknown function (DUF559)